MPDRRSFLGGLASLPMIGGGVALLGKPTGSAEPITENLLYGYKGWLHHEHRMLSYELAGFDIKRGREMERWFPASPAWDWHWRFHDMPKAQAQDGWGHMPNPSTRAAVILSAVGCDWRAK